MGSTTTAATAAAAGRGPPSIAAAGAVARRRGRWPAGEGEHEVQQGLAARAGRRAVAAGDCRRRWPRGEADATAATRGPGPSEVEARPAAGRVTGDGEEDQRRRRRARSRAVADAPCPHESCTGSARRSLWRWDVRAGPERSPSPPTRVRRHRRPAARPRRRRRAAAAPRGDRVGARHAVRIAIAVTVSWVVAAAVSQSEFALFAPITTLLVVQSSPWTTLGVSVQRILGTGLGVLVASVYVNLVGLTWWSFLIGVLAALLVARLLPWSIGGQLQIPVAVVFVLALGPGSVQQDAVARARRRHRRRDRPRSPSSSSRRGPGPTRSRRRCAPTATPSSTRCARWRGSRERSRPPLEAGAGARLRGAEPAAARPGRRRADGPAATRGGLAVQPAGRGGAGRARATGPCGCAGSAASACRCAGSSAPRTGCTTARTEPGLTA